MRDLLQAHGARVTFFVTRFAAFTPAQRVKLHALADEGHDIQAHGAHHWDAAVYAAEHGIDAYIRDEFLPELTSLRDDGFTPDSFAYPFGSHTAALDTALAPYVRYLRGTAGHCPL